MSAVEITHYRLASPAHWGLSPHLPSTCAPPQEINFLIEPIIIFPPATHWKQFSMQPAADLPFFLLQPNSCSCPDIYWAPSVFLSIPFSLGSHVATPELAIQSLPARSSPGARSLGHFTLQQVQCMGKTSPSKTFTSLLWVTQFCSACGSVTKSTAVATLQGLLVVLVSSALVSLFSSKLQISGIG